MLDTPTLKNYLGRTGRYADYLYRYLHTPTEYRYQTLKLPRYLVLNEIITTYYVVYTYLG